MSTDTPSYRTPVDLGYPMVDADHHYYEPDDCFSRHLDPAFRDRTVELITERGKPRPYLGGKRSGFFSASPCHRVSKPGALFEYFETGGGTGDMLTSGAQVDVADLPWTQNRSERLRHLDTQGVEAVFMFPSLAVGVEYELSADDPEALGPNLTSFNRWIEEDWGFDDGRIISAALLSLHDIEWATAELERVLAAGARLVHLRPGPVSGQYSPADPRFDPFWARVEEAGVPVAFHLGDSGFCELFTTRWGEPARPSFNRYTPFQRLTAFGERAISDTLAILITHNLFGRFPRLRVLSIENGCEWVQPLVRKLDRYARMCGPRDWLYGVPDARPRDIFIEHVRVAPYPEDDSEALVRLVGPDAVLAGSDFPHPEGLPEPTAFAHRLTGLDEADVRKIMRANAASLIGLAS
jgi:predicted TIM-barrel fold metal-dependent hydrolase